MAIVFDCNSNVIVITDCRWNATGLPPPPSFVNNVEVKLNSAALYIKIKLIEQRT